MTECHTFDIDPVSEYMRNMVKSIKTYVLTIHDKKTEKDVEYRTFATSEEQAKERLCEFFGSNFCVKSIHEEKGDVYY